MIPPFLHLMSASCRLTNSGPNYGLVMADPVLPATRSVSIEIPREPKSLWKIVSDPSTPARFSNELQEASFAAGDSARVGAIIDGRNQNGGFEWSTQSIVTKCDPPHVFEWSVGDPDAPLATWSFVLNATPNGSILTHTVTLHESDSYVSRSIKENPETAEQLLNDRLAILVSNMQLSIQGIATLAAR